MRPLQKFRLAGLILAGLLLYGISALAQVSPSGGTNPIQGHVDSPVHNGAPFNGPVPFRGWALLPGSPVQFQIRVQENGAVIGGGFANLYSPFTAQTWGQTYAYRGFDFPLNLPPGDHYLVVSAVNPANGALVPLDPCQMGPLHIRVGTGSLLRGAFTAPRTGQPTTSVFDLEGFLLDDANPSRTISGVIKYRSDVDAERQIPITANLSRADVGPHGFKVRLTLTTSRHWYFQLFGTDASGGCQPSLGMLNLDLVCPVAQVAPCTTICPGGSVSIGKPPPVLYGEPWKYSWSPTAGLSDPTSPNPLASPAVTTTYRLTVTDPAGACSDSKSTTVSVVALSASAQVVVAGCAPAGGTASVSLSGEATGGSALTYSWDFESDGVIDQSGLASPAVAHEYAAGSWVATLRAEAALGNGNTCSALATAPVTVATCVQPPTGCAPRTVGYWSQQFDGDPAQKERACDYRAALEIASGVFFEKLPSATDRCVQMEEILNKGGGTMFERAVRQLLALRLNVATGKIAEARWISLPYATSTTVGGALAEIEGVLTNALASETEQERAKDIADALNNGCGYNPTCESSECQVEVRVEKTEDGKTLLTWNATNSTVYTVEKRSSLDAPATVVTVAGTSFVDGANDAKALYSVTRQ